MHHSPLLHLLAEELLCAGVLLELHLQPFLLDPGVVGQLGCEVVPLELREVLDVPEVIAVEAPLLSNSVNFMPYPSSGSSEPQPPSSLPSYQ